MLPHCFFNLRKLFRLKYPIVQSTYLCLSALQGPSVHSRQKQEILASIEVQVQWVEQFKKKTFFAVCFFHCSLFILFRCLTLDNLTLNLLCWNPGPLVCRPSNI